MVDTEAFDWDDANIEHIARHGVEPEEVEEALLSPTRVLLFRRAVGDEARWTYAGETDEGRLIVVVHCRRAGRIRTVTARLPTETEARTWRRRNQTS